MQPTDQQASHSADIEMAIAFLNEVYANGPWCLVAIDKDRKGIECRTFWPDDPVPDADYDTSEAGCRAWLAKWNNVRNLYWTVNVVAALMVSKPANEDIKEVCYLHVDVDCRNDPAVQSYGDQRAVILDMLLNKRPKGAPEPTIILDSGGGYQAFWKLEQAAPVYGDKARAEDLKRYNQQLELLLGGDNCHDISRVMRLPFTVNLPNAQKAAKGRVPVRAGIVSMDMSRVYPLGAFTQVAAATVLAARKAQEVNVGTDVKRVQDLDELDEWKVPPRVKVIIAQGHHPDPAEVTKKTAKRGGKPPSRSEWLFDVVCNLVRNEVPDELVYGIITDPKWGISESVIELKGQAHRYAIKQIASAKDFAADPKLAELNARYFVVSVANKTLVGEIVQVPAGKDSHGRTVLRDEMQFRTLNEFQNFWEWDQVQVGTDKDGNPRYQEAGKWWRKNPKRRQYNRLVMRTDIASDVIPNDGGLPDLNLWRGFCVEVGDGQRHGPLVEYLRTVLCRNDPVKFHYLWKWLALKVQNPDMVMQVALVFIGEKGTGKTFFAELLRALFGQHVFIATTGDQFIGKFNGHTRDCLILISDEAYYPNDKSHQAAQKNYTTGATRAVEMKGIDVVQIQNTLGLVLLSNDPHVVPATDDERRYFVARVSDDRKQDTAYFGGLARCMDEGGLEDLLGALKREDLSGFEVRRVPQTEELAQQKTLTQTSPIGERVAEALAPFEMGACFQLGELMNVIGLGSKVGDRQTCAQVKEALHRLGYTARTIQPLVWNRVSEGVDRGKQAELWFHPDGLKLRLMAIKPDVNEDWVVVGGFEYADKKVIDDIQARLSWVQNRSAKVGPAGITVDVSSGRPRVICPS